MKFNYPCVERTPQQNNKVFRAIFQNSAIWKPGQRGTITIDFLETLSDSEKYASSMVGPSRVSPSMYLGYIDPPLTSFRSVSGKQFPMPSLREIRNHCSSDGKCPSGWVPGSTVVHEFGHALGMLHEHQNDMNDFHHLWTRDHDPIKIRSCWQYGMGYHWPMRVTTWYQN